MKRYLAPSSIKSKYDPKKLEGLLKRNAVKQLVEKAQKLSTIDAILPNILPNELVGHCRVMNLIQQTLVLEVDSAAHAFPLRYQQPDILMRLQQQPGLKFIQQLQHRVRPSQQPIQQNQDVAAIPPNPISSENMALINDTAEHIENEALKKALLRLAAIKTI